MIEKNIKNLFDHITRLDSGGRGDTEEDAMFTKKPFGPVNCASCEKDVVNLQGIKADFLAWKRLPERNPGDRIARYGQGFSKMLNMIKSTDTGHLIDQSFQSPHTSMGNAPSSAIMSARADQFGSNSYKTHHGRVKPTTSPHKGRDNRSGSVDMGTDTMHTQAHTNESPHKFNNT